jgi:UDP-N-acetylmuramate--alanine ligase
MIEGVQRVHLIGIGGIGVSGVARALLARGYEVSGSDVRASQITRALEAEGASVSIGHSEAHLEGADLVVYSTAIPESNPERVAARARGIPTRHRAEVLGWLVDGHQTAIGVVGTHGKGTVASAITWILETARRNPGFIIGGLLENFGRINARLASPDWLVAEVDESDGSLRHVHPTHVVVNNLELDHLHYYKDLAQIQETVREALAHNARLSRVFVNAECPGAMAMAKKLPQAQVVTFGREAAADLRATDLDLEASRSSFTLAWRGETLGHFESPLAGSYNVDNATAAAACTLALGIAPETVGRALADFRGLENRFTVVERAGRRVIKDYISHPTGIRRVLEAAKQSGRPITAVFKPYRFTMINYLQDDYAQAFHDAQHTVITELYTAGEVPIPGIDTEFLCQKIRSRGPEVSFVAEMEDILPWLHAHVPSGHQVIFFGGDDLFELAERYLKELSEGAS